jgi:CDP-diacylglycerol--glycerol-3-phosphate 3-phosphatidyltransferase
MKVLALIPNFLTLSRVLATIFMCVYYYFEMPFKYEVLFVTFVLSSISDFFDGYLSRKWNVISNFGTCMDPISDKLLLIIALVILVDAKAINIIVAFVFITREVIISGLREFLALSKVALPVSRLAKWKTAFQLIGLSGCFLIKGSEITMFLSSKLNFPPFDIFFLNLKVITHTIVLLAVYTTIHTGALYIWKSRAYLK